MASLCAGTLMRGYDDATRWTAPEPGHLGREEVPQHLSWYHPSMRGPTGLGVRRS